ncbi:MAG: glycosyltransferase family 4 protein [Campylobacter sp.]|uniref:glycosyltransferase family 4 protein n=1 Tax=Campylobacter sp. TaxID=205 RepID=UPI002AA9394C|nr:glycosyltransferase family 1 protein [Campylobacter sp.]MCI6344483.1 glycosyltransferase family 4 protein [Campylobacter sp.]
MKKIKIVFDATIITSVRNDMKFGIFNVAKNLLIEFMKRNDVEIRLFSRELNKKLAFDNLKKYTNANKLPCEFEVSTLWVIKHTAKRIIDLLPPKIADKLKIIIRTFVNKCFRRPKVESASLQTTNNKKDVQNEFFFSPFCATPKCYKNLQECIVVYDTIPMILDGYAQRNGWFFELCDSLNTQSICFSISEYTKSDFLKHLPHLKPENIIVTPLACDERFKPVPEDKITAARQKYKIPSDKKYIFSLCTLEPRKNLLRTVKCFANFISKNNIDDLVFVLGGAHWDAFTKKLENEIGSLDENIKTRILKIGYVDDSDQAALYSGALFFVYTSAYEGFGLPPLEAMSCGTPVITSNNSSLPEVVGNAGIMIDYDDDAAHIKAYESYYYNENLRKENSKKGLERAGLFSWEKCADIMITEMKRRAGL